MFRSFPVRGACALASALLSCDAALAQEAIPSPQRVPTYGGRLELATGEWDPASRGNPEGASEVGSVVYDNTAPQGHYLRLDMPKEYGDYGRVPSPTSPDPERGTLGAYQITGFEFGYVTQTTKGNFQFILTFYDNYEPCLPNYSYERAARFVFSDLPGSPEPGVWTSYVVTIDLRGGAEFCLRADGGNMGFDNNVTLDSFAYGITAFWINGGPLLAGDPTGAWGPAAPPGDGTVWHKNVGLPGTGLGTEDQIWERNFGAPPDQCVVIKKNPNIYDALHLKLYANLDAPPCGSTFSESLGDSYCDRAGKNSTGREARLSVVGSTVVSDGKLTVWGTQMPYGKQAAYVLMGTGQEVSIPPGANSRLCVQGGLLERFPMELTNELPGGFKMAVELNQHPGSMIAAGSTWNFQAWYRDGPNPSNLSNAVSVTFE